MNALPAPLASPLDRASADASGCQPAQRAPALKPGDIVGGKYLLLHRLGIGGMGQVWMARNSSTGAEVAVKTLLPELASSPDALIRFKDEAFATAKLAHRGIVQIFDLVELDPGAGTLLMTMELLRGHTLAQRIANQGPLSVAHTLEVVLPLLSALSHAHGVGVVHRDVKPDNVFLALEPDGEVLPKLVDFGISQLRELGGIARSDGLIVGTAWYMSPEQERGEEVDARCDVFGVGLLLYECLSGANPFRTQGEWSIGHRWTPAPIDTIPATLWAVIARALAERPDDRFSSAAELANALRAATAVRSSRGFVPARRSVRTLCGVALAVVASVFAYQSVARIASAQEPACAQTLAPHAAKQLVPERSVLRAESPSVSPGVLGVQSSPMQVTIAHTVGRRCAGLVRDPGF